MVLEEEVLLLASLLLESLPIGSVVFSDMSVSLLVMSLLELVPVPISENISLLEGVVVLEGKFEIFSVIVLLSENILL